VVSRKKTRISLRISSRRSVPHGESRRARMLGLPVLRTVCCALSCALVKPIGYSARCSNAPITTNAAAVDQRR
jgi:hypothetical protein